MSHSVSPGIFFLVEEGKVLAWNCMTHTQHLITLDYFSELLEPNNSDKLAELKRAGIVRLDSCEDDVWGWDILSKFFHHGTRDTPHEEVATDPAIFYKEYCRLVEKSRAISLIFKIKGCPN